MRLELGLARVEFYAVKEDAARLLGQGHMYAKVYAMLKKQNKITMSYAAFYYYARQECPLRKKRKEQPTAKLKQEVQTKQASASTVSVAPPVPVDQAVPERTGPRIIDTGSSRAKAFGKNDFDYEDMISVDNKE